MALLLSFSSSSFLASPSLHTPRTRSSALTNCNLMSLDGLRASVSTKVPSLSMQHPKGTSVVMPVRAASAESPPLAPPNQKIRIKLRSYWIPLIEEASAQIQDAARSTNTTIMGPVRLPTKRRVYCVLRSPFVNKDSREHFEIRTHQRLIDLENPNAGTIDALMQLDIAAGVDVEVKLS